MPFQAGPGWSSGCQRCGLAGGGVFGLVGGESAGGWVPGVEFVADRDGVLAGGFDVGEFERGGGGTGGRGAVGLGAIGDRFAVAGPLVGEGCVAHGTAADGGDGEGCFAAGGGGLVFGLGSDG